ncbi:BQ5605_C008g05071 [Microbotryum silenes-dioicae]|uniref:Phosphoribosylformylglycinamidine cyclo-ligase n=1 Tax=Microbotryum silenes-dioicae TaxID=796604 RepID=A0A2X0MGR3_9BASI|nr:BQ5605_C008g05071 [Microbotryum silenes-dioicae]
MATSTDAGRIFEQEALRILLVGNGGREHALAWKLEQSSKVEKIFVAPGKSIVTEAADCLRPSAPIIANAGLTSSNGGTTFGNKVTSIPVKSTDFAGLRAFALENDVNFVVIGPEQPLVDGLETVFRKGASVGIPVFGPSVKAAAMEGSKTFSKDFMARHNIPTAQYKNLHSYNEAVEYVKSVPHNIVIKASGLAGGKGVIIPSTKEEALQGLKEIMVSKEFGTAGDEVVVEECLVGQEISVLSFSDGYTAISLPGAQDHKRIGEGDTGPNTGGMGTYSPAPCATKDVEAEIHRTIVQPTIDGMRKDGMPFVGLLFTGIMLTADGPKVLEYNVRFGDPETQSLLALLAAETDLAEIMLACVEGRLDSIKIAMKDQAAVTVVLASKGYPGKYGKGVEISFDELPKDVVVFHAGTAKSTDGKVVTDGGRVLAVTATAATLKEAQALAYKGVACVHFEGATFRKDIAYRAFLEGSAAAAPAGFTYASAGVSIDAGNALVDLIKPIVKATKRIGSDSVIGGFGGLFDLKAAGYKDPILVAGTDGVGTKLKLAQNYNKHDTIGIDLVAMSVNDLIVQGAEPLFFLDYYACGHLDVPMAADVVKGVADGCIDAGCALVGGETAEMPSLYHGDDYDVAGFAVGAVERELLLPTPNIAAGDVLLGIASSGIHSNGFSLVRKIVDAYGMDLHASTTWNKDFELGAALLEPTVIYVKQLLPSIRRGDIKGLSHITGGGFTENVPRVLPKGVGCWVDASSFEFLPLFKMLMKLGRVDPNEMARTFNCGIGMVVVVAKEKAEQVKKDLEANGKSKVYQIGKVQEGEGCVMRNLEAWSRD